ncbi:hypothetical protein Q7P37_008284 [Cladosporium fusiforme]
MARILSLTFVFLFQTLFAFSLAADQDEWRSRSIYQIVTDRFSKDESTEDWKCKLGLGQRCGGTWRGIQNRLDYVQDMGFDAIWISPVVKQLPNSTAYGQAYAGYWQQDLYSLDEDLGTEDDLHALISDVHSRGMFIMLDVIVNHMAWAGTDIDYSKLHPFDDKKYYHKKCSISDYGIGGDAIKCWLGDPYVVPLPDLRTEDDDVRDMFGTWISGMVANYSIDGLRIDSALHVESDFFTGFMEAAGVFGIGEVLTKSPERACQWESTIGSIFNYASYYAIIDSFAGPGKSMDGIVDAINDTNKNCNDPTTMGSFSENHDVSRFASITDDLALAKNVLTYTMLSDGIPVIYQGQEQHQSGDVKGYFNREALWEYGYNTTHPLYLHVQALNAIRHHAVQTSFEYTTFNQYAIYSGKGAIAFRKGNDDTQIITVLTNDGQGAPKHDLDVPNTGFKSDLSVTDILSCETYTVGEAGVITLQMTHGEPQVLYPSDLLYGSGLCDYKDNAPRKLLQPQQTTMTTAFPTTIAGEATVYSTASTSPLPGPFKTREARVSKASETLRGPEPTGTGESGVSAVRLAASSMAMAVFLAMVLCCL